MPSKCAFCDVQDHDRERIIEENDWAFVIRDGFPVTRFHTLIIPKRHTVDYFGLNENEVLAINTLLHSQRTRIQADDSSVQGFNIGMNCGEVAGQSVWHCHIHLIPRREGDVKNPRGGVRTVISGKGDYLNNQLSREPLKDV